MKKIYRLCGIPVWSVEEKLDPEDRKYMSDKDSVTTTPMTVVGFGGEENRQRRLDADRQDTDGDHHASVSKDGGGIFRAGGRYPWSPGATIQAPDRDPDTGGSTRLG